MDRSILWPATGHSNIYLAHAAGNSCSLLFTKAHIVIGAALTQQTRHELHYAHKTCPTRQALADPFMSQSAKRPALA